MSIWESFSVAGRGKPAFGATNNFFTLGAPVGPDQPNRPEDVIKVETILGNTGDHDLVRTDGPTGFWSPDKENAVRSWQAKNGLKVDGLLKPNGPTITSLKRATGSVLGGFIPPTPQDVDQHHAQRAQDEPGILNLRRARLSFPTPSQKLELDEASRAFNADSARALSRSSVDGDIPRIYADYVKQAGIAESHPTIMDLAEQMNATVGRDRTDRVLHGIVGQLPADQAKELLGGAVPAERPLGVKVADLSDDHDQPLFRAAASGGNVLSMPMPPALPVGQSKPMPPDVSKEDSKPPIPDSVPSGAGGGNGDAPGLGGAAGISLGSTGMPTTAKNGGIAGGGKSGKVTSPASVVLRDMTGGVRVKGLRPFTGTTSVGGSIGRAIPFLGVFSTYLDYLNYLQSQDDDPPFI